MVTVRELLSQEALALRALVLPHPDAPVRWVAASELANPTPFLEGGEILLTTGLARRGSQQWVALVEALVAVNVVALGLGTGLTHATVPEALVRACQAQGLNLFEVPAPTSFVAVSRATIGLLHQGEIAECRRVARTQRELVAAATRRDDQALLVALARHLGGGALLLARDGSTVAGTAVVPPVDLAAEIGRLRAFDMRASASLDIDGEVVTIQPIGTEPTPETYLAAWSASPLSGGARATLASAVALLGLSAGHLRERREADRQLRARALDLLLLADVRSADVVLAAGGGGSLPDQLRLAYANGPTESLVRARSALEASPAAGSLVVLDGSGLCLAGAPADVEAGAHMLSESGLQVGLGVVVRARAAARSLQTARAALRRATAAAPVVRWDDVQAGSMVSLMGRSVASQFATELLAPVADRPELLVTLHAFVAHHGARGAMATELNVHRNTVRNRLTEIEDRIGRSLDDPETRASLWLALEAMDPTSGSP